MIKSIFKKTIASLYKKIITKVAGDLKLPEHERLIHHLISRVDEISEEQTKLRKGVRAANTFISGLPLLGNPLYENYDLANVEINELLSTLLPKKIDPALASNYLLTVKSVDFKNRAVCLIGARNSLYLDLLKKLGARKVIRIEASARVFEESVAKTK